MRSKLMNPPRAIYIHNVAGFIHVIQEAFNVVKYECHLRVEDMESIVDWVITDILQTVLAEQNTRVLGHYRNDEAKLVRDNLDPKQFDSIRLSLKRRFRHLTNTDVKVLVSSSEMFIAAKYTYES